MTNPIFQQPGRPSQTEQGHPPTGRTGTCPECGGENLPILGRRLVEHRQKIIRSGKQVDAEQHCDGSWAKPEPGTEERPPRPPRPRRNSDAA